MPVDQNFLAAVPVHQAGRSMAVLRIGDGMLGELVDLFLKKSGATGYPLRLFI